MSYVKTKKRAVEELWKHITLGQRIGVGGSVMIRDLRILEKLQARGCPCS